MDFSKKIIINSSRTDLLEEKDNLKYIALENDINDGGRRTSVLHFSEGQNLEGLLENSSKEILVLSGELENENLVFSTGSYFRIPKNKNLSLKANQNTSIFIKENAGVGDDEKIYAKPASKIWYPGHGNLKVMPLHNLGNDTASLVWWPAGEKFTPHKHWGGEEIFVMSGEFIDEHGRYPTGTWIRSPHLSSHFPYVEKDTIILVKVGHLI